MTRLKSAAIEVVAACFIVMLAAWCWTEWSTMQDSRASARRESIRQEVRGQLGIIAHECSGQLHMDVPRISEVVLFHYDIRARASLPEWVGGLQAAGCIMPGIEQLEQLVDLQKQGSTS
jgi:hypothetical protein